MADHFNEIYRSHADRYAELVRYEDAQGNLPRALAELHPLDGARVVECGAGTGRVTLLLAPVVQRIHLFDVSPAMLGVAVRSLRRTGYAHWLAGVADNRALPLPSGCADLALEGWSFGHLAISHFEPTFAQVGRAIDELLRVLRPGGTAILIETLGTGATAPHPPSEKLAAFYDYLETVRAFRRTWIRTDFCFESQAQGEALMTFFFGDSLSEHFTRVAGRVVLPECTGLWSRCV